jgi:hypothetical protein
MTDRGRGVILVMAGGREAIPSLGGSHRRLGRSRRALQHPREARRGCCYATSPATMKSPTSPRSSRRTGPARLRLARSTSPAERSSTEPRTPTAMHLLRRTCSPAAKCRPRPRLWSRNRGGAAAGKPRSRGCSSGVTVVEGALRRRDLVVSSASRDLELIAASVGRRQEVQQLRSGA